MVIHMSSENLEQFQRVVLEDVSLQHQLLNVSDRDTFLRLVVQLGATRGYLFTVDDVRLALQASRRAWVEQKTVR